MQPYTPPQKMTKIGDLFERYKTRLKPPQSSVEKECAQIISEVSGFTVAANQVAYTVTTRTISLKLPSVLKTELRFHQTAIMQQLEARLGKDGCPKLIL